MYYQIGVDETQPAPPFVRIVAPTDIQKVAAEMCRIIKDYYPGIDILNIDLWRKVGFDGAPVIEFLQRMIGLSRERKDSIDDTTINDYKTILRTRYGYDVQDMVDYTRAFLQAKREGLVPNSILRPYEYEPTTVTQDVIKTITKDFGPLILGAIAVYALVSVFLPNVITGFLKPRKTY